MQSSTTIHGASDPKGSTAVASHEIPKVLQTLTQQGHYWVSEFTAKAWVTGPITELRTNKQRPIHPWSIFPLFLRSLSSFVDVSMTRSITLIKINQLSLILPVRLLLYVQFWTFLWHPGLLINRDKLVIRHHTAAAAAAVAAGVNVPGLKLHILLDIYRECNIPYRVFNTPYRECSILHRECKTLYRESSTPYTV